MNDFGSSKPRDEKACRAGCRSTVPEELESQNVCVQHFLLSIENECHLMRREAATGLASIGRRREINGYVKSTAMKLSEVATSNTRLSDEMKKKVLTAFLTLMNLQESVERSRTRPLVQQMAQKAAEAEGMTTVLAR